jgi:hypothetical protein
VVATPTMTGSITHVWQLDAVVGTDAVLAHIEDGDDVRLALIDPRGITELGRVAGGARYQFRAAPLQRGDGARCAVFTSSRGGLFYACEGQPQEAAGIANVNADRRPIPFLHGDGTLSVYTQTYSSFTVLRRSPSGQWQELEQYESSVSYPTDVASTTYGPLVCFIASGGRPVVDGIRGTTTANDCKLAVDGAFIHVLAGQGYARMAMSELSNRSATFTPQPIEALTGKPAAARLALAGGKPHALGVDGGDLVALPLPGGAPVVLASIGNRAAEIGWDERSGAVSAATAHLDTSGGGPSFTQTITLETRCLD